MDPTFFNALTSGIVGNGLPSILMSLAIWWLQRSMTTWIGELSKERAARMDDLERRCQECEKDRMDLRNRLLDHLGGGL